MGVNQNSVPTVLMSLVGGIIGIISLVATSEGIKVFIDIEENTRSMAMYLKNAQIRR